jgi:hypothetical protein
MPIALKFSVFALLAAAAGRADLLFLDDLAGGGSCVPCTFTAGNKLTNPAGDLLKVAQLTAANTALDNSAMLLGGAMRGMGLNDVTTMIMNSFMAVGQPVNVVLVGHGAPGRIQLGGSDILQGSTEAAFSTAVKGKVGMLTLFGCCVAAGTGPSFLQMLANDTMAQVKAYNGTIGVAKGTAGVMDGFYVAGGNSALQVFTPVPEPGTLPVFIVGLAIGIFLRIERRWDLLRR